MQNNINLTTDAAAAIKALQHPCGTYQFYRSHLDRLFTYVLDNSDEIGMSDNEAMETLRALNALRSDLAVIAGPPSAPKEPEDPFEEISLSTSHEQLDEPHEMLHDIGVAMKKLKEVQGVISEAIGHARNAGDKYISVVSELADIVDDLKKLSQRLDDIVDGDDDNSIIE